MVEDIDQIHDAWLSRGQLPDAAREQAVRVLTA